SRVSRQSTRKWSVNSAWLAMSARYSQTSSRGRAIVTSVISGSTGRESTRRRAPAAGPSARGPCGARAAAPRAAQLAHARAARVEVDALPDPRCPAAVGAVPTAGLPGADALAQELAFEVGLGDAE